MIRNKFKCNTTFQLLIIIDHFIANISVITCMSLPGKFRHFHH